MFSNVRWRIALWFIGLSAAVYIVPTALALFLFYANLTTNLDTELTEFIASFGHAIDVNHGFPQFRDWEREVETSPAHSLVSYQLFDRQGHLLEQHGPPGIPTLVKDSREIRRDSLTMRSLMTPMTSGGDVVGFLQVQISTKTRDESINDLALITAMVAPLVLLGLGWCSYLVSEKATVSILETNSMLRRFIADASHELNTPLGIAQAANETLEPVLVSAKIDTAELKIADGSLERMQKTIEDLMLLSQVENPVPAAASQIDFGSLVEDIVTEFGPKFKQKNVSLIYNVISGIKITGDAHSMERLVSNLLENGLRYTDKNGEVTVALKKLDSGKLILSVEDTGIGIPAETLPKIFDRFYRVDQSRSRKSGGVGLGLSIVKAIVHAHHGSITVESTVDHGSRFAVILPTI